MKFLQYWKDTLFVSVLRCLGSQSRRCSLPYKKLFKFSLKADSIGSGDLAGLAEYDILKSTPSKVP